MKRRDFLIGAAAVAAAGFARPVSGRAAQIGRQAALDRISMMTLNFQSILKVPDVEPGPNRTLELFDLPTMVADTYGVHKIEYQHYHIASTEPVYLRELRASLDKARSTGEQINLEFGALNISADRLRDRLLAIDLTKQFVDHAKILGVKRLMINQGQPTTVRKAHAIEALKRMSDYGKANNVIISVETRGGGGGGRGRAGGRGGRGAAARGGQAAAPPPPPPPPPPPGLPERGPATWQLLAEIIEGAGAYSNVDVGGAGAASQQELHDCLRRMFPFTANALHSRVNNANWDFATAIRFLETDLGYKGLYTIEAGGHDGTKAVYDVIMATLPAL
jgi:hypothetical protein